MKIYCDLDEVLVDFETPILARMNENLHLPESIKALEVLGYPQRFSKKHLDRSIAPPECFQLVKTLLSGDWDFWASLPWMSDGRQLWRYLEQLRPRVILLTSPIDDASKLGKYRWCLDNLRTDRVIFSNQKERFAGKDCILIDDYEKNIEKWEHADGVGIYHRRAEETLKCLKKILK